MDDVLLVAAFFLASTIIGLPFCLLFPADRFEARILTAPPLGFGVLSVCVTALYMHGVHPRTTAIAVTAAGALFALAYAVATKYPRQQLLSRWHVAFALGFAFVVFICLLPAWTGGLQFSLFQGNVHDQSGYLSMSTSYSLKDHDSLFKDAGDNGASLVFDRGRALFSTRPAVNLVHVALPITHISLVTSVYAYLVAMQCMMLFVATFVLWNMFPANRLMLFICAAALTIGPFQQYILDINAWSHLAGQPLFLLLTALVVFALGAKRFDCNVTSQARLAALGCVLFASVVFLYPEALGVFVMSWAGAGVVAILLRPSKAKFINALCLAAGTIAALAIIAVVASGLYTFFFGQLAVSAKIPGLWSTHYHRHLLGREAFWLDPLWFKGTATWRELLYAWFSLPLEATVSGFGLFYILPTAGWPIWTAIAYKLILYAAVATIVVCSAKAITQAWRQHGPDSEQALMTVACVAGLVTPLGLLITRNFWSAGKAFYMAVPLLFLLLVFPLLLHRLVPRVLCVFAAAIVAAHLTFGLMRPILAADPSGSRLAGLPASFGTVNGWKQKLDWRVDRWIDELKTCRHVVVDIYEYSMDATMQLVLTNMGVQWSQSQPTNRWSAKRPLRNQADWDKADCIVTSALRDFSTNQRIIYVRR